MVQVTKAQVMKAMNDHALPFWFLMDGRNIIDEMQDEETTLELSQQKLEEVLSNCTGQSVLVKLSDYTNKAKAKAGRSAKNFEYTVKLAAAGAGAGGTDNMTMTLLKEIFNLKVEQVKTTYEHQMDELRREVREAKEEKSNPLLEQAIGQFVGMFKNEAPQASNLAGPPETEAPPAANQNNINRMRKALNIISRVDPDLPGTLETIAELASKQPEKYKTFIPLIKTQL